ncbi:Flp family type IVb pilin [Pseudomonas sp. LF245]|jgi:Flp pilus assembly pilin Flp
MQIEESIRFIYFKMLVMVSARDGASGIEYAIVAAMCAAVIGIFMTPISDRVKVLFNLIEASIAST